MAAKRTLLDRYIDGQVEEWSVFVCGRQAIFIDGVRAFNPGDAVPASHVSRGIVEADAVVSRDDARGMAALEDVQGHPAGSKAELPGAQDMPDADTLAAVKRVHAAGESA